jgi:hypothetical protein
MKPTSTNAVRDSNYLPIDPDNIDARLFTSDYMRMFGGYGALSQINPQDYNNHTDVFKRAVGSAPDSTISASSTLFNYLTVTPGFTKVSSLNYRVYRDAKIQMYTPVRYLENGKVVLDSRGLIASMVPVSEKELPTADQFKEFQNIGEDDNKRVDLAPDPNHVYDSDDEGHVANVDVAGVYNPNFLFFVKVSDVTPEKMTVARNAMTARNGLKKQEGEKKEEAAKLIKMKQASDEKDQATSAQQKKKQEAISNALNKGRFMYDITDLLRDDRSVNFLNDLLARYDIYESPLVGGGDKTFVGVFDDIKVTCQGTLGSFKLTLNVFKPVVPAVEGLLIGSTKFTIRPDARMVNTTTTKYWVNALEMNSFTIDNSNSDQERLKNFSLLDQKSVDELDRHVNAMIDYNLKIELENHKKRTQDFDGVVGKYARNDNPFFKKIYKDDSGFVFVSYFGYDCYGYEIGVAKTTPIYMGKLQSVKGNDVELKKWYKPKNKGGANNSCDFKYSLAEYEIYIFRMPEDPITKYSVDKPQQIDDIDKLMEFAVNSAGIKEKQKLTILQSYDKLKQFLLSSKYGFYVKTAFDAGLFKKNNFYEQFTQANDDIINQFDVLCGMSKTLQQFIIEMRVEYQNSPNTKPSVVNQIPQPSPTAASQPVDDVIRVGDAIKFKIGMGCNSEIYKYAFVVNVKQNLSGSMSYGLFPIQNRDVFKYAKSQIESKKQLNVKCTVLDQVIDKKVPINEVEEYFNANPTISGGAKHTRRPLTGMRKNATRHGNRVLMRRRTHKGRKRIAYSKTAKK